MTFTTPVTARRAVAFATAITVLAAGLLGLTATTAFAGSQMFTTDGTLTIPPGVTLITVEVGGGHGGDGYGTAGFGAKASATLTVTPGQVIPANVGGQGGSGAGNGSGAGGSSAVGPGGAGAGSGAGGGGGGGASAFGFGGPNQVIAGGGGGGGDAAGGSGSTPTGVGTDGSNAHSGGGSGGSGGGGGIGGTGGAGTTPGATGTTTTGGAGGGTYGGGGGGGYGGGGGGGETINFAGGGAAGGSTGPVGTVYGTSTSATGYVKVTWNDPATVTFDNNGGTGSMANQLANVPTTLTANTFTRTGYTFNGWNTAANGTGTTYANIAPYPFTTSATLYAQWVAVPNQTVTFDNNGGTGSMANQLANVPTALTANAFTRTGYTFSGWNTTSHGTGTAYANKAVYPFSSSQTLYAQWAASTDQTVVGDCVTPGTPSSIPRAGAKALMGPGCKTNAGQRVGSEVSSATPRGDRTYYRLYCSYKGKKLPTSSAGYGGGYRTCRKGSLKIRTYGTALKLRIGWYSPATTTLTAYKLTKKYAT